MSNHFLLSLILFAAYLIGSVPFGVIIATLYGVDLRQKGSGNIGATNVLRTLGPFPAGFVFSGDLLKGTLAVAMAAYLTNIPLIIVSAGIAAMLGHIFSIFLKGQGGRGAATGLGIILGITPNLFLYTTLIFIAVLATYRYVSLATILSAVCLVILMVITQQPLSYSIVSGIGMLLIILRHLPNIQRLLSGKEHRIGARVK